MKLLTVCIVTSLLFCATHGVASATDASIQLRGEVHHFVEQSYDVALSGNNAYIASGTASGLRIVDLSDPSSPYEVGSALNSDNCAGVSMWMADMVRVSGAYAYVLYFDGFWSFGHFRLYVYDVSDPASPQQRGFLSLPDNCTGMYVAGNRVYITAFEFGGFSGVLVIDVADPAQPREVGAFFTPGMPQDLCVADALVYVADNDALAVYDISDLNAPRLAGRYVPTAEMALIEQVVVRGTHAFLIDAAFGIRVLDSSDPGQMIEVASLPHDQSDATCSRIDCSGDLMYHLEYGDTMRSRMRAFDISDPGAPGQVGCYRMQEDWWFYGFDCDGLHACIASGADGLIVMDVADPASMSEIGLYRPHGLNVGVAVTGEHAFVTTFSDSENVILYDVADPASPQEAASLTFGGRPKWPTVHEQYLYLPGVEVDMVPAVAVLDISDPTAPALTSHLFRPQGNFGVPMSVGRFGNYALVAMAFGGVQIYDVTTIGQPLALGSWTLWDPMTNQDFAVRNVKVSWPYAFVADESYGLHVLDISNPLHIIVVADHPTPGSAWWVELSPDKHTLYLADFSGGVRIFDVSHPLVPTEIGYIRGNLLEAHQVLARGEYLYVTDGKGTGLHMYDVSDPASPVEIACHDTPGIIANDIALDNGLIYLADLTHFEIFEAILYPTGVDAGRESSAVSDFKIISVYPNPFNPVTAINYTLPAASEVTMVIWDISGREVATLVSATQQAGKHSISWNAGSIPSGVYLCRLQVGQYIDSRKVVLVR